MTEQEMRYLFADKLDRQGEKNLAIMVRSGGDNSNGGVAALEAIKVAYELGIDDERNRCSAIVSAARFDEVDRDFRAIGYMIDGGATIEQLKS